MVFKQGELQKLYFVIIFAGLAKLLTYTGAAGPWFSLDVVA